MAKPLEVELPVCFVCDPPHIGKLSGQTTTNRATQVKCMGPMGKRHKGGMSKGMGIPMTMVRFRQVMDDAG